MLRVPGSSAVVLQMAARPIAEKSIDFTLDEVLEFLRIPSDLDCSVPPVRPKGREIYRFSPGENHKKLGVFMCYNIIVIFTNK